MYMPHTAPSDLGEMLKGAVTFFFLAGGLVVGLPYRPFSDLPLIVAAAGWGLGAILVYRMEADGEFDPRRMKFLGLLATPMLLLFLNGLLDTRDPILVEARIASIGAYVDRRGNADAEIRPLSPDAPFQVMHRREPAELIRRGAPVRVILGHGAFGLLWFQQVELDPKRLPETKRP